MKAEPVFEALIASQTYHWNDLWEEYDTNKNGTIERSEFLRLYQEMILPLQKAAARRKPPTKAELAQQKEAFMARLQATSPRNREKRVVATKPLPDFGVTVSPRQRGTVNGKAKPLPDFSVSPRAASPMESAAKVAEDKAPLPHFRGAASSPVTHKPPSEVPQNRSAFAAHPQPRKVAEKHGRHGREERAHGGSLNTTLGVAPPTDRRQLGRAREVPKPIPDFSFQRSPQNEAGTGKKEPRPLPDFSMPFKKGAGNGAPFAARDKKESPLQMARAEAQAREAALMKRMSSGDKPLRDRTLPNFGAPSGADRTAKLDRNSVLKKQAELQRRAEEEKEAMRAERAAKRAAAKKQDEELMKRAGIVASSPGARAR